MTKRGPRHIPAKASRSPFLHPKTWTGELEEGTGTATGTATEIPVPDLAVQSLSSSNSGPGVVDPDLLAPVLLAQPDDPACKRLLDLLYQKWAPGKPLGFLCEEAGIEFDDLVSKVERHYSGIARIHATRHYVEIFEDTAIDAKSRVGMCDRCHGTGHAHVMVEGELIRTANVCAYCEGSKFRRYAGDRHSRAIMFEAMGIVGKSRQPLVAIQQNISVGGEQASRVGFAQKLLAAGRGR